MSREWIKLHKRLRINRRYLALTPAQRSGYIALLIEADDVDGTFDDERQLRAMMRSDYKFVPKLRAVGLLNSLSVHNWETKSAPQDNTAATRKRRERDRKRGVSELKTSQSHAVTPTVTDRDSHASRHVVTVTPLSKDKRRLDKSPPTPRDGGAVEDRPPGCPDGFQQDPTDPDLWLSPDGGTAWVHEHPPSPAQAEVRLRNTAAAMQEVLHQHSFNASFGRLRRLLSEHPGYTARQLDRALKHPATVAEAPTDGLAFVTAPYADNGISILERVHRGDQEAQNTRRHQQVREEEREGATSVTAVIAEATRRQDEDIDPDDLAATGTAR